MQELIIELVAGYTQSKFEEKYLREKIQKILKFIVPQIAVLIKNKKEKELLSLWGIVKEEEKIKEVFHSSLKTVERPIVIYVASKFINNQSIGPKIIKEALKWQ